MASFFLVIRRFEALWVSVVTANVLFCEHFGNVGGPTFPTGKVFGVHAGYVQFIPLKPGDDRLLVLVLPHILLLPDFVLVHGL